MLRFGRFEKAKYFKGNGFQKDYLVLFPQKSNECSLEDYDRYIRDYAYKRREQFYERSQN